MIAEGRRLKLIELSSGFGTQQECPVKLTVPCDAMLSSFDHRIILKHSPKLGVARREKAYYAHAFLFPRAFCDT